MTGLGEARAGLEAWLPYLRVLRAEPGTGAVTGRKQPCSRPPWNPAAENLWFDIHALPRRAEADFRLAVTGTAAAPRGGSDRNTLAALAAAVRLAEALPPCPPPVWVTDASGKRKRLPCPCLRCDAARQLARCLHAVLQLPAIDEEQPWREIPGPCPRCCQRCARPMLRYRQRDHGQPAELRCIGCGREGRVISGTVSAGCVEWSDGTIT